MKKTLTFFLTLIIVAGSVTDAAAQRRRRGGRSSQAAFQNGWFSSYATAKQVAREKNKPLMVVFRCVP